MDTLLFILAALVFLYLGFKLFILVANLFATLFALIMVWILVEPAHRAERFSLLCDEMFKKKST